MGQLSHFRFHTASCTPNTVRCDGMRLRAGISRNKRVALLFLDDRTGFYLHAVVGTWANSRLFLTGLRSALCLDQERSPVVGADDCINPIKKEDF